jgi:ligand-binding sensor domain-containing protein
VRSSIGALIASLVPFIANANVLPPRPMRFAALSLDQGLSQSSVYCVHQDRDGFIWLCTEDGLNRYDGATVTVFRNDPTDAESLPASFVWDVAEDAHGDLWIATDGGGLARRDRATERVVRYGTREGLSSLRVRAVHVDAAGRVWIGTSQGLDVLDPATGAVTHYRADPANSATLSDDRVTAIHEDGGGVIWIGTRAGLNRYDASRRVFTRFQPLNGDPTTLTHGHVRSLLTDAEGTLWVGTSAGLSALRGGGFETFKAGGTSTTLSNDVVWALALDSAGRLWVGTEDGLNLFDREKRTFARYGGDETRPGALGDGSILSLYSDHGGVLWVGTRLGGAYRWNPRTWSFGHTRLGGTGAAAHYITSFAVDVAGKLLVGTLGDGLHVLDRAQQSTAVIRRGSTLIRGLTDDRVMSLLFDREGRLWAGTMSGGLHLLMPGEKAFRVLRHDPARADTLGTNAVMSLLQDRQNRIWVGTYNGGLNRVDPATGKVVRHRSDPANPHTLSSDIASCIAEGKDGGLWVGTEAHGLNLLDPETGRVIRFRHDSKDLYSLSSDTVLSLLVSSDGRLWAGTRGGGVNLLETLDRGAARAVFRRFAQREGLSSAMVYGLQEDTAGSIWLATNAGLSVLDPRTMRFRNYDVSHGVQASEFNFGAHYRSSTAELFFGGVDGFNAFYPERIEAAIRPPDVVLTSILKLNQPVALDRAVHTIESIDLSHSDDVVTFEFAAMDFAAPGRVRYAYRMDGFNDEWIDLGNERRVTYTDLDSGRYVLRVRAENNDGLASEREMRLAINVQPPPWRTWWAHFLYALAGGAVIAAIARQRQLKARRADEYRRHLEQEVEARVRDIEALIDLREKEHLREFLKPLSEETQRVPSNEALTLDLGTLGEAAPQTVVPSATFSERFDNLEAVGRGGMGIVYRARDRELDETVAIKLLRKGLIAGDEEVRERFKREIKLARRVTHPNVLRLYEFGEHNGTPYISMEFVEGVTLKQVIASLGAFPLVAGMCIARQACAGLGAAHAHGIVHRDVKPHNMLVLPATGALKIADFGISRATAVSWDVETLTARGAVIGTPEYIAPEQALGREISPRTDVYAMGVVLFEVFTGTLPFVGETPMATILLHIQSIPPQPSSQNPAIPPGLEQMILRCLEKDPAQRFADANDLLRALTATVTSTELSALAAAVTRTAPPLRM